MLEPMMEIRAAEPSRLAHIAEVIGRAFVTEPMMAWPLGGRTTSKFGAFAVTSCFLSH